MPAPSLEVLFSFENAIETAWQTILAGQNITCYIEASDVVKVTPYVDAQLLGSVPYPAHGTALHPVQDRIYQGVQYNSVWQGTLVSTITTTRGVNSDQQVALIGTVRTLGQPFRFTSDILPYHAVLSMLETGLHRGLDQMLIQDWSQLSHLVTFGISNDAWP